MPARTALSAALAVLTLLAPGTADAQRLVAFNDPAAEAAPAAVAWSVAVALGSPVSEVRRGALAATVARLRAGRLLHTAPVVPALLAVYASDPEVQCRLGAVVALHATAMAELRRLVADQPSRSVQIATLGALVDHHEIDALDGAADPAAVADQLRTTAPTRR